MAEFPSLEWARRLCEEASRDNYMRHLGSGISEDIVVIVEGRGGPTARLYFRIVEGVCVEAREATEADVERATLAVAADYRTWVDLLCWRTSPTMAYFRRKLRVLKGSLRRLLSHPLLHYQLYFIASRVGAPCRDWEE